MVRNSFKAKYLINFDFGKVGNQLCPQLNAFAIISPTQIPNRWLGVYAQVRNLIKRITNLRYQSKMTQYGVASAKSLAYKGTTKISCKNVASFIRHPRFLHKHPTVA